MSNATTSDFYASESARSLLHFLLRSVDHALLSKAARRRRPNVGVSPAPFSWRVHVMLYTSYMLLDFCNAVYNEALTLTKTVRTIRACFAIALNIQMKHGSVKAKVFSWTILWNRKLMLKVSSGPFFANLVNKADGTVKVFNSVYCSNCL